MFNIDKTIVEIKAKETNFIRDNLEKVYRLISILNYINSNKNLADKLVLKGGTAINLTVFDLPRLSVDIDFDYNYGCDKETMLKDREFIAEQILKYMNIEGYTENLTKGKDKHSLNSWVFYYNNSGGNRDNIKIEINYSMRCHILPVQNRTINIDFFDTIVNVFSLDPCELFGSKIKALLERTAARDLYDLYNMIKYNIFAKDDFEMLKKCVLFYQAVGCNSEYSGKITFENINNLTFQKVRQTLFPVLRKNEKIDIEKMKKETIEFLNNLLILSDEEKHFQKEFKNGNYKPELLFEDKEIIDRVKNHPMALWKCSNKE